jgi:hypothetical protein
MEGDERQKGAKIAKRMGKGRKEKRKKCHRWESDPSLANFDRRSIIEG